MTKVKGARTTSRQQAPRTTTGDTSIRPFRVQMTDEALADLRQRLEATQWPEKETVNDASQGVPLATMQELARYWATDYDWRKAEAKLNALAAVHHRTSTGWTSTSST